MNPYLFFPLTALLVIRAYTRASLTPAGILAAIATASIHGLHPTSTPFLLLLLFYTLGTVATRVKHDIKSRLTISASASSSSIARTHIQVLANSAVASILTLLHVALLNAPTITTTTTTTSVLDGSKEEEKEGEGWCFSGAGDLLMLGIVANYAAVTADTLSSELGILSKSPPRLVTSGKVCAPGTNGGVSLFGLVAGAGGAAIIGLVSALLLPFCKDWSVAGRVGWVLCVTAVGTGGSLLDSVLGAVLQESVVDVRSGKIVEGAGGAKVLVRNYARSSSSSSGSRGQLKTKAEMGSGSEEGGASRRVAAGWWGVLSNNGVNFVMALGTTVIAMVVAAGGVGPVVEVVVEGVQAVMGGALREGLRKAGH